MPANRTGYLYDERFLLHDTGDNLIPMPSGDEFRLASSAARS